ncbi:MAG: RNA-binding protein [Methanobrevibacter sp.]|jgi:predicted SPOUT superfamily RNA methylase MTH1|nr:RNA-binding protein [Candidatus Methanovirga basalitermitum]
MQKVQLSVFLPDSFLTETKDLKLKTSKIGIVGRALAVFSVSKVVIYRDTSKNSSCNLNSDKGNLSSDKNRLSRDRSSLDRNYSDGKFISKLLKYMDTPQYLRKRVFPIESDLKHVGILPPLRTPNHPTVDEFDLGQYRQGFTVKRNKKGTFVDIGIDKLVFCKEQLTVNKVFSFKVVKIAKEVIVTPDVPMDRYWGYEVLYSQETLKNSLKLVNHDFVLLATRYGHEVNSIFDDLKSKAINSKSITTLFGGPYSGISENACESIKNSRLDVVDVNTLPDQGTETVRTEEALISTLAILNMMIHG